MAEANVQLEVRTTAEQAAQACAAALAARLNQAIESQGRAAFAISGGSSPKQLFALLAAEAVDWTGVHLFWVDERCVPANDAASNYGMALEMLIRPARIPEANVHRVPTELQPTEAARAYAEAIAAVCGGQPAFDVIHRGIGPDAHTASLFPGEELISSAVGIAAAVWVEQFGQWRVTLTPTVLRRARYTVVYAPGADKAEAVAHILEGPVDPILFPAQVTARFGTPEHWFLDEPAASRLTPGS